MVVIALLKNGKMTNSSRTSVLPVSFSSICTKIRKNSVPNKAAAPINTNMMRLGCVNKFLFFARKKDVKQNGREKTIGSQNAIVVIVLIRRFISTVDETVLSSLWSIVEYSNILLRIHGPIIAKAKQKIVNGCRKISEITGGVIAPRNRNTKKEIHSGTMVAKILMINNFVFVFMYVLPNGLYCKMIT